MSVILHSVSKGQYFKFVLGISRGWTKWDGKGIECGRVSLMIARTLTLPRTLTLAYGSTWMTMEKVFEISYIDSGIC